jgi:serine protease
MKASFLLLTQLILSKKFIIEVRDQKEFIQTESKSLLQSKLNFNLFSENKLDTIEIGDFKAILVEYPEFPLFLFNYNSVLSIEEDRPVSIDNKKDFYLDASGQADLGKSYYLQNNPIWNLDRIDQRPNGLNAKYFHPISDGKNTNVFVVDTGVDITHSEFEGRAVWGANFADSNDIDCQGHGTHVAGTIGSKSFGVAKKTNLIAVKVLGCNGSGSYSGVLKGLEYVINKHRASNRTSVVNMSLGGPKSDIINKAIDNLVAAGIHVIVAAGNENVDACNTSPANNKNAITVAATTKDNKKAYFSNFGICVNILSPGTEILSTIPGDKTKVMQGTSMASPMVAGVFALILTENPGFKPDNMKRLITSLCTKNTISGFDLNTPNCFLYSLV